MATHTTVQGEMWDSICYKHFGSSAATNKLMMLNRAYLGTYIFPAGIELELPDVDTETEQPTGMVPWKVVSSS